MSVDREFERQRLIYHAQLLAYARDETERAEFIRECRDSLCRLERPGAVEPMPPHISRDLWPQQGGGEDESQWLKDHAFLRRLEYSLGMIAPYGTAPRAALNGVWEACRDGRAAEPYAKQLREMLKPFFEDLEGGAQVRVEGGAGLRIGAGGEVLPGSSFTETPAQFEARLDAEAAEAELRGKLAGR